jgi:hypothetical protein
VDRAEPTVDSAVARLEAGFRWDEEFGKKPFFEGEVEPCINGGTLALGVPHHYLRAGGAARV